MKWRQVSPSSVSIFCSSDLVPSVAETSAWVSPRVKIVEPWARGRYGAKRPARLPRRAAGPPVGGGGPPPRGGAKRDRLEHGPLGPPAGARLDHRARLLGAGDDRVEAGGGLLILRRVRHELARH